jgi:hypothetical protein
VARRESSTLTVGAVLGAVVALASARSGMASLIQAANIAYQEREKRGLLKQVMTSVAFTLGAILGFILMLLLGVAVPLLFKVISTNPWVQNAVSILRWALLWAFAVLGLALIYRFAPARERARWRWVTWGSVFAATLWLAVSILFAIYIATFGSYAKTYGALGGYVKASDAPSRQEGWFEVMVGKSLPREGNGQVFAFVHRLEPKPNERMERFLAEQGVFPAQPTTFLSDGGETVRQAQGEFRDFGEPILDWFHVAMRTTQLTQSIKGLAADPPIEGDSPSRIEELLRELIRAKAYLWHGSPHRALRTLEDLTWEIGTETPRATAMQDKLDEFMNYIVANTAAIPNYADRHRHGEPIATGFVESAVNQVVSKRLVKKQQMRWTMAGAHRLLQVRTRVLNQQLRNDFERWHPQLRAAADPVCLAA